LNRAASVHIDKTMANTFESYEVAPIVRGRLNDREYGPFQDFRMEWVGAGYDSIAWLNQADANAVEDLQARGHEASKQTLSEQMGIIKSIQDGHETQGRGIVPYSGNGGGGRNPFIGGRTSGGLVEAQMPRSIVTTGSGAKGRRGKKPAAAPAAGRRSKFAF
jgi:hypothetical protein